MGMHCPLPCSCQGHNTMAGRFLAYRPLSPLPCNFVFIIDLALAVCYVRNAPLNACTLSRVLAYY